MSTLIALLEIFEQNIYVMYRKINFTHQKNWPFKTFSDFNTNFKQVVQAYGQQIYCHILNGLINILKIRQKDYTSKPLERSGYVEKWKE